MGQRKRCSKWFTTIGILLAAFLHLEIYRVYVWSCFKLQVCWLHALTRNTDSCQLIGMHLLAAFLHLEIYRACVAIFQIAGEIRTKGNTPFGS
jgi:hypothetical protein